LRPILKVTLSPNPMKGQLTAGQFTADSVVTSPADGLSIYDPTSQPSDGSYTLTFADKKLPPVPAPCVGGVCKVDDA
jgi:hypothetical protein